MASSGLAERANGHVISVRGLRKHYGETLALDGVSFEVAAGEIFGLIGPNGSGKTTTVECLQGLRVPDAGEATVLGLDPAKDAAQLHHRVGSQLQESALPDRLRVGEALELFASMAPRGADWRSLLDQWGLAGKRKAAFATLSGGQRQRLFIALALVNNPEVVFFDEMSTGLDPTARRSTWELIRQVRERGTTVVLVTHFMDEAEYLCDRIAVFKAGRVVAIDSAQGLVDHCGDASTVCFSTPEEATLPWLAEVPGARSVKQDRRRFEVEGDGPILAHTAAALVAHGIAPEDLHVRRPTLEDVFLQLTGGEPEAWA
jgi:ABC-2 type transport system ATP-binding protein